MPAQVWFVIIGNVILWSGVVRFSRVRIVAWRGTVYRHARQRDRGYWPESNTPRLGFEQPTSEFQNLVRWRLDGVELRLHRELELAHRRWVEQYPYLANWRDHA